MRLSAVGSKERVLSREDRSATCGEDRGVQHIRGRDRATVYTRLESSIEVITVVKNREEREERREYSGDATPHYSTPPFGLRAWPDQRVYMYACKCLQIPVHVQMDTDLTQRERLIRGVEGYVSTSQKVLSMYACMYVSVRVQSALPTLDRPSSLIQRGPRREWGAT